MSDKWINAFLEKYDKEALASVDLIANDIGLNSRPSYTLSLFNIQESAKLFTEYLQEYTEYKVKEEDFPKKVSHDVITEHTRSVIANDLIKEEKYKYKELPSFIKSYIESINSITSLVESIQGDMLLDDVNHDEIGFVTEAYNLFMEKFSSNFYDSMDKILTASGYNTRKKLNEVQKKYIFL